MYFYKNFFILTKISFYWNMYSRDFVIIRTTHITPPLHGRAAADGPCLPGKGRTSRPCHARPAARHAPCIYRCGKSGSKITSTSGQKNSFVKNYENILAVFL